MLSFSLIGVVRNTFVPSPVTRSSSESVNASHISLTSVVKVRILLNRKNTEISIPVTKAELQTNQARSETFTGAEVNKISLGYHLCQLETADIIGTISILIIRVSCYIL
jgi:hypothetical protein